MPGGGERGGRGRGRRSSAGWAWSVGGVAEAVQGEEVSGTKPDSRRRPLHRHRAQDCGAAAGAGVSQCRRPTGTLVQRNAVVSHDRADAGLGRDVVAALEFGQRLTQRAATDVELLGQQVLTRQQFAGAHLTGFNAPREFVDHAFFLVKSNLSNHVQIDIRKGLMGASDF